MPYIPYEENGPAEASIKLIEEPHYQYWFHLGKFMYAYALAESALISLLHNISGLPCEHAGVVFHGTRSESARDIINNILSATDETAMKARLSRPFAQMASIGTVRNNLVHWGATALPDRGAFRVSNANRHPIDPKDYTVTIADFQAMCDDLNSICLLLYSEMGMLPVPQVRETLLQEPWRYKSPQPAARKNTQVQGRTGRPIQPRTSRSRA